VQYGSIITELKGKVGGQVFQGGNNSKVLRNQGYKAGNTSSNRRNAINAITSQAATWRSLTDLDRAAWSSITDTWVFTDKFGNTYYGSGYQVFVAWNSALINMGFPPVTAPSPPELLEIITFEQQTWSLSGSFIIEWNTSTADTQIMQVFVSPPLSAGRNNFHKRSKIIATLDASDGHNYDVKSDYQIAYGQPTVGSRVVLTIQVRGQNFPHIFQTYQTSYIIEA